MKFSVLLDIFIELLSKRMLTAKYLAEKYALSPRTVYRYVEVLSSAAPVQIKRCRCGGIYLSDCYTLPTGFLRAEEYDAMIDALSEAYVNTTETRFLQAKRKLSATRAEERREKTLIAETGDLFLDETALPLSSTMLEKLRLIGACMRSCTVLEIEYLENGEKSLRKIDPHTIAVLDGALHTYAFCHTARAFRLFRVGRILSAVKTQESFRKRPFEFAELSKAKASARQPVRLEINERALERAYDWLGAENIRLINGRYIADVLLFDNAAFQAKLNTFGEDVKVISPKKRKNE